MSVSEDQCARFQLPPPALIEGRMSEIAASGPEVDRRNITGSAGLVSTQFCHWMACEAIPEPDIQECFALPRARAILVFGETGTLDMQAGSQLTRARGMIGWVSSRMRTPLAGRAPSPRGGHAAGWFGLRLAGLRTLRNSITAPRNARARRKRLPRCPPRTGWSAGGAPEAARTASSPRTE